MWLEITKQRRAREAELCLFLKLTLSSVDEMHFEFDEDQEKKQNKTVLINERYCRKVEFGIKAPNLDKSVEMCKVLIL